MPKIRKKTSKRTTTHLRAKVKRKVSDSKKKAKKLAKKDVTWKSNKPKDIGIPNSFPFKEQVLEEQRQEKIKAEEEKLARREAQKLANSSSATLASTAALAAAMAADSEFQDDEDMDEDAAVQGALVTDSSLKLHAKSLRKVLESSDVIVEVLDARDPVGTRCRAVERELRSMDGGRKKLVLVLNKIDLVPASVVQAWLAYLRLQAPTLPFKSSTQQQRNHLSSSSINTPSSASGSSTKPLLELIKGLRLSGSSAPSTSQQNVKTSLTIGVIGHPNVGKSSLINTLKRSKACSVAPTPGWTKEVQEIGLEKGVRILDCPGVVVEAREENLAVLRGLIRPEDVEDPRTPVNLILERCKKEHLMMLYNIPYFSTATEFLVEVARGKGRLRKGGVPDLSGTARSILRDWVSGRIPYYTSPPALPASTSSSAPSTAASAALTGSSVATTDLSDLNTSTLLTSFAPAFDLAALFGEADLVLEEEGGIKGNSVKMQGGGEEEVEEKLEMLGEDDEEEMEDDDGLDVDDLIEEDEEFEGLEDDEEDEDDEMEEDEPTPVVVKAAKKTTTTTTKIVSVAPAAKKTKEKSVSFAVANTKELLPAEAGINKSIKNKAKKDKKAAAKASKAAMEVEAEHGEDAAMPSKPRGARVVKGSGMDVEFDAPYDFTEFFPQAGAKGQKAKKVAFDDDEEL